ncbi:MAG: hypothetical protein IPL39_14385 [Opitutaceae bacterium]|nr:hypothetical protein [Opitutaceae bacterium]
MDDCVDALLRAGQDPAAAGRVFNLGGRERISLADLARLMVEVNGAGRVEVREFPAERKKIDIGDYYADWTLIRDTLGWRPRTALPVALRRTLAYYRKELKHYL